MAFSKEEIRMARQTDLVFYLQHENELARKEGRVEPYRLERDGKQIRVKDYGGLLVTGNMWNQRSTLKGGNTLDFLTEIEKIPFKEAVEKLLRQEHGYTRVDIKEQSKEPKKPFVLPEKNDSFKRVIAYLTKTRGLDPDIVLEEIKKGNIYEDKEHHNVVFVGREPKSGEPRWAQKRTTLSDYKIIFEQAGSDPKYPYFYGNRKSKAVIVVESPIEALSYASLLRYHGRDMSQAAILSLGGVHDTALKQYLKDHPQVDLIITALNNDRGEKPEEVKGHEASLMIKEKYHEGPNGRRVRNIFPKGKDWNDDLRAIRAEELAKKPIIEKERTVEDQIREYAKKKALERKLNRGPVRSRTR